MKVDATVARQFVMLRYPACVGKVVVESSQTHSHLYLCQGKSPLASNIINSVKKVACECAHLACTSFNFFFANEVDFSSGLYSLNKTLSSLHTAHKHLIIKRCTIVFIADRLI